MRKTLVVTMVVAAACLAGGYVLGRRSVAPGLLGHEERKGAAIATFRGGSITAAQVDAALGKAPVALREQLRTTAAKKGFVEELVRFELFAAEGERLGLQRDPEFLRRYKELLGRAFLEKQFEQPQREKAPTDAELRAFFDANKAALARPMRARIAVVQYAAATGDGPGRAAAEKRAEAALARLRAAKDPYAFAQLASAESQDPGSRRTNGELPFLSRDELAQRLGDDVAAAAFDAPAGTLAPRPVESATGFFVVKVLAREEGYEPAFEEVREMIRTRLAADRRTAAYEEFLKALKQSAAVKLDEKAVEALVVD